MELPNLNLDEISRYLDVTRNKGAKVISLLGKLSKYFDAAINNEVGRELLKDDIIRMEELLEKIANEDADDKEMAEYRYLKNIRIPRIVEKIRIYVKAIESVKKVTNVR